MNNKLMSYQEALTELKRLEKIQRLQKRSRKSEHKALRSGSQKAVMDLKKKINVYLTIIHLYKMSMKMYGELNERK